MCKVEPNINTVTINEEFGIENVMVKLQWNKEDNVTYNATITPQTLGSLMFNGSTSVQISIQYNTIYKVNITATSALCGQGMTSVVPLHYGEYIINKYESIKLMLIVSLH